MVDDIPCGSNSKKEHLQNLREQIGIYKKFIKHYDVHSHRQTKWMALNQLHSNINEMIFKEHEHFLYEYHQVMALYNELESLVTEKYGNIRCYCARCTS